MGQDKVLFFLAKMNFQNSRRATFVLPYAFNFFALPTFLLLLTHFKIRSEAPMCLVEIRMRRQPIVLSDYLNTLKHTIMKTKAIGLSFFGGGA